VPVNDWDYYHDEIVTNITNYNYDWLKEEEEKKTRQNVNDDKHVYILCLKFLSNKFIVFTNKYVFLKIYIYKYSFYPRST
jgi:hypothetical protein